MVSISQPASEPAQLLLVGTDDWTEVVATTFEDSDTSVNAVRTVDEALAQLRDSTLTLTVSSVLTTFPKLME